jgi:hypothetical protein
VISRQNHPIDSRVGLQWIRTAGATPAHLGVVASVQRHLAKPEGTRTMTAATTTPTTTAAATTPTSNDTRWTVQERAWKQDLPDLPDDVIALLAPPVVVSASTTSGRAVPRAMTRTA